VPAAYFVPNLHCIATGREVRTVQDILTVCHCVLPLHFHFVLYAQSKGCAHCIGHAHRAGRAQYVRHAVCANCEGRTFGVGRSNVRNVPTVRECPPVCYMSTIRDLTRSHCGGKMSTIRYRPVVRNVPTLHDLPTLLDVPTPRDVPTLRNVRTVHKVPTVSDVPTVLDMPTVREVPTVRA
jgi:hypothetical protein